MRDAPFDENSGGKNQNGDDGSLNETTHWCAPGSRGLGAPGQTPTAAESQTLPAEQSTFMVTTWDDRPTAAGIRQYGDFLETRARTEPKKKYLAALTIFGK
jgi:hypothetical protein